MNNAVLRRELRRLVPSKMCWGIAIVIGLLCRLNMASATAAGAWLAVVATLLSLYWANRSMQAELEEETIEHLGTLPIAPLEIVFQIGLASAASALLFTLVTLLLACPSPLGNAMDIWLRGAGCALAAGWLGAMGAFRYGESLAGSLGAMGPMTFLLAFAFMLEVAVLRCFGTALAMIGTIAVGAGTSLMSYYVWRLMGGQWVESIIPRPDARRARARAPGEPPESVTPAPDWSSPVFWYELCANRTRMRLAIALPSALILAFGVCGYVNEGLQEGLYSFGISLGTLVVTLVASSSAAQHRRTGLWTDLAVTPLSTRRIVLAQLAGTLARCVLIFCWWMASAWLAAGFETARQPGAWVPALLGLWIVAAVCGYLAGACTTGWKAGLLGVFLLYLTMCLMPLVKWATWYLLEYPYYFSGSDWITLPVIGLWTVCLFYACVRRVASFQA